MGIAKRSAGVSKMSPGRREDMKTYRRLRDAFLARNPWCVRCGIKRSTDVHHKRGRRHLLLDSRFWAAVCRQCHKWIGMNPAQAQVEGLLAKKGQWLSPDP